MPEPHTFPSQYTGSALTHAAVWLPQLPFGKIIQAADQQAPEQQSRVIGWSSCQSFAFMEFVQLFGVISSVDQIIGSVEGFGGCFSTETIALASQGQDSKRVL